MHKEFQQQLRQWNVSGHEVISGLKLFSNFGGTRKSLGGGEERHQMLAITCTQQMTLFPSSSLWSMANVFLLSSTNFRFRNCHHPLMKSTNRNVHPSMEESYPEEWKGIRRIVRGSPWSLQLWQCHRSSQESDRRLLHGCPLAIHFNSVQTRFEGSFLLIVCSCRIPFSY